MNIVIVSDGYPTAKYPLNGVFAFDQAKALRDHGHEVLFISIDLRSIRRKRKFGKKWTNIDGIKIIDYSIPLGNFPLPILLAFGKFAIKKIQEDILIKLGKPDAIHAHFITNANLALSLKKYFQVPLVITEHSSSINKDKLSANILKLGKATYLEADRIICVSKTLSNRLRHHWGVDSVVVPNILDTTLFTYKPKKESKKSDFIFLSVGNLNFNKGFDVLIEAFRLANLDSSVTMKIIGDGELRSSLNRKIQSSGLSSQIQLMGFMDRNAIASIMKQAHAFVLASRSETFGVVYIEAMATGLPVISTACGGPEDFINNDNGILVPVENVNSLAEALKNIHTNINKYDKVKISENSKLTFSPSNIAFQITNIYNSLLNNYS